MKLKVICCGDAFGSGKRLQSCFYLESDSSAALLDCGSTAYFGLKRADIDLARVQTIVITHFHGDHFGGLPHLLLDEAFRGREESLTLVTPQTGKARITALLEQLYPGTDVLSKLDLEFEIFMPDRMVVTDHLEITPFPVVHTNETHPHAVRIALGAQCVAYSGDTEWTSCLLEIAHESDLFLCECNSFDQEVPGHINYRTFQQYEDQLTSRRILLTHLGPDMLANLEHVSHECAEDGMEVLF